MFGEGLQFPRRLKMDEEKQKKQKIRFCFLL